MATKKKAKKDWTGGIPNEDRHRKCITITMSEDGIANLTDLAEMAGVSRSVLLEQLVEGEVRRITALKGRPDLKPDR